MPWEAQATSHIAGSATARSNDTMRKSSEPASPIPWCAANSDTPIHRADAPIVRTCECDLKPGASVIARYPEVDRVKAGERQLGARPARRAAAEMCGTVSCVEHNRSMGPLKGATEEGRP